MGDAKLPQPFDNPSTYKGHSGVDYGQPMDKLIKASGVGKVYFVGWLNDRAGWSTVIDYGTCGVLYAHQPVSPGIKPGTNVSEGSQIGRVGTSGNSTGPHVHMEIMWGEGAHTYEGVWKHFSKAAVVGDGSSAGIKAKDEDMIVWLKGRKNVRSGGVWLFKDGVARWLSTPSSVPTNMVVLDDERTINQLLANYKVAQ